MIPYPWPDELRESLTAALLVAQVYEQEHALGDAAYEHLTALRRDLLRAGSSTVMGAWSPAEARAQSAAVALLTAIRHELDGDEDLATRWRELYGEALDRDVN